MDGQNPNAIVAEDLSSVEQYKGTVFVIPFDAPLPNELKDIPVASGTFLTRLQFLNSHEVALFEILPLRGDELIQLSRLWATLVEHKKVYAIRGLPGARYDVLFDQGLRAVGVPEIQWDTISTAMARAVVEEQRTTDATPWKGGLKLGTDRDDSALAEKFSAKSNKQRRSIAGPNVERLSSPGLPQPEDDDQDFGE